MAFLLDRLRATGLEPYGASFDLPYRANCASFTNLVGVARGHDRSSAPLLIGAHYDTAGDLPGADDNAAAVAIALEVADRLVTVPAARDVLIALFDAEEPPYFQGPSMGSTWFYGHQRQGAIHAAFVMDLVGHAVPFPDHEDVVFVTGVESDADLEHTIAALPDIDGLQVMTALNRYVGDMSDHHVFRLHEVPYLFLTCGRWRHYHTADDTPEKLDYAKMARIADLVEAIVRDVGGRGATGASDEHDPTLATDLATMRRAMGPTLERMGMPLRDRADIERVAAYLMGRLGL